MGKKAAPKKAIVFCTTSVKGKKDIEREAEEAKEAAEEAARKAEEAEAASAAACGIEITLNVYDVSQWEFVQWFNALFAYQNAPIKLGGFFHVGVQVGDEECLSC
eukprot:s1458_g4.t1